MNTIQTEIKEFIKHCIFEKNLGKKTIKAYETDLLQITKYLSFNNYSLDILKISKIEIRGFLETMSNLKPKTIKRKIAVIKTLFNYLEYEDKITINPFRKMRIKIKDQRVLPKVMDINEVKVFFESVYKQYNSQSKSTSFSFFESMRNVVVIELLFATGARVSEIANLKIDAINVQSGEITIKGKGDKERSIQICNAESLKILRIYKNEFQDKINTSGGYFLVNRFGNNLSDQSIRNIVKSICKRSEISKNITPHIFRHTLATLLLENDVDLKYIQSILGHSSVSTTQIYTHVNSAKQRQILETRHPRKNIIA